MNGKTYFNPGPLQGKKANRWQKKPGNYQKNPIRIAIWAVLILFVISGVFAIKNSNQAIRELSVYKEQLTVLQEDLVELQQVQALHVPETNAFLSEFLQIYFTVDTEKETQEQRIKSLQRYNDTVSFRVSNIPRKKQEVISLENYGYTVEKENVYRATYSLKTRIEDQAISESFVHVRFMKTENGFTILSLPYQLAYTPETFITQDKEPVQELPDRKMEDKEAERAVQTFVSQFFKEYQENNQENLKYLMKDVQGLPNGWTVQVKNLQMLGDKEAPVATCVLEMTQADTGISFHETLQLFLSLTEDGKYFIDSLTYE